MLQLVTYKGVVYEARDFETGEALPSPERAIWIAQTSDDLMDLAQAADVLFATPADFGSFKYMIRQSADRKRSAMPYVMIRHEDGLAYLTDMGIIKVEQPAFTPNFINHRIIDADSEEHKYVDDLFRLISDWVGGDDQAHSLLFHLSTVLQPGWSARKYLLLLGGGSNGKSTLLLMLQLLLGKSNVSRILRQDVARRSSIISALNNKLANIVFDGPAAYIAESGPEKTLTAGEPLDIEMKFENEPFTVETNALFIEGLQKEPKARDKSQALQNRIVRFYFPNEYAKDLMFEATMKSEMNLNALLTLLWEHWVAEDELAIKLRISEASKDLQIQSEMNRSAVLAFIEDLSRKQENFLDEIQSGTYLAEVFVDALQPWLQTQGYEDRTSSGVWEQVADHFVVERVIKRIGGRPRSVRVLASPRADTRRALEAMRGVSEDDEAVVRE